MAIPLSRIFYLRQRSWQLVAKQRKSSRQPCTSAWPRSASSMASSQSQSQSHTYAEALALLNTLQSNRAITNLVGANSTDRNAAAIPEMLDWVRRAGYSMEDFNKLRVIHVAGTKGKGSVCATISSILSQYQKLDGATDDSSVRTLGKIGLYTSPHLTSVRERICIDGRPIDQTTFTKYFFDMWSRFSKTAKADGHENPDASSTKPFYFRYLTIMALHLFMKEGVETAIIECGIGGEYDSTNVLTPASVSVSAITRLGIDHTAMLGNTIDKIAWHKAGILKTGVPAITTTQEPSAQEVLEQRAKEKNVELATVGRQADLEDGKVYIGLEGDFQKDNASLAVAVSAKHLQALGFDGIPTTAEIMAQGGLPPKFVQGLAATHWDGRCQIEREDNIEWHIDGAHTMESIEATARWFASRLRSPSSPQVRTMLIFNQQERDSVALLSQLHSTLAAERGVDIKSVFDYVAIPTNRPFTPSVKNDSSPEVDCSVQWRTLAYYDDNDQVKDKWVCQSIEEAAGRARAIAKERPEETLRVLVTGSLYLVGGFIGVLRGETEES